MAKWNKGLKGISGWLIAVLLLCMLSWISNFVLLIQKIISITIQPRIGIFVSASLLLIYSFFMGATIFMILTKKKSAIRWFIISIVIGAIFLIWYYLISLLIYYPGQISQIPSNLLTIIINVAITVLIAFSFIKSRRVKNTFVK